MAGSSLTLRPAKATEASMLTELCLRSKAVWGYDAAFMAACRRELAVDAAEIAAGRVQVAVDGGRIIGVAQVSLKGDSAEVEKLFIEPDVLRSGAGCALFDWCVSTARASGAATLWIDSDPDAVGFYRRMGATEAGVAPSGSIPGRVIPRLKVDLASVRQPTS